ncbi:MAG: hypothetical protein PWP39_1017 [Pyrococcus sp.]|uniref:DUF4855 domain-containing protein n=1 Tax=Pyrococcus sp. TaxID=33866 RepID=UPI002588AC89|nr:DUF4855 domain-containing protein [Pyrococcus sp.]MDK2869782.1 hypothetical protein [Pyrococcus sp.]
MIFVSRIALWWIRWNDTLGGYESRMTLDGRSPGTYYDEVQLFKERGFDRVVFLGGEGRGINYTGNGFEDARYLALWIRTHITSIDYYITIPFSYGSGGLRDNPANGFKNSYWREWIDGVLGVDDDNRLGFYWSYESCLQTTSYDEAHVTEEFIQEMSDYIHSHGLELIWIPTIGNRTMEQVKTFCAIPTLAKYFDNVFVQPHYYQTTKLSDGSDYTFQELVRRVEWMKDEGLSIEMEADNSIIGEKSNCAYCKSVQGWWQNDSFHEKVGCDVEPTPETEEKCIDRACDYYKAIMKVSTSAFSTRAYYFGTDFKVVDKVKSKCPGW